MHYETTLESIYEPPTQHTNQPQPLPHSPMRSGYQEQGGYGGQQGWGGQQAYGQQGY